MTHWQQLVQQGILGTIRQPTLPALPRELAASIASTGSTENDPASEEEPSGTFDLELRFLQRVALLTQYEATGLLPHSLDDAMGFGETTEAAAETTAAVSEHAAALLRQLLVDFDLKLMVEWVEAAARHGHHLPHDALPALLEHATKHPSLAAAMAPCLGERGRWLVGLNPAWRNRLQEKAETEQWQLGSPEARVTYLETLRHHAPDEAREALRAVWSQEAAAERTAFLATLRTNLTAADLPFLEEALGDRSINVRITASRLLAKLPSSPLHKTLSAEVIEHLSIERQWLKRQLNVALPKYFRDHWHEWGIREQSPLGVRIGQKMGWLVQLLVLLPPSVLIDRLDVDAVDLLALIRATDHAEALLTALLESAEQHQDFTFLLAEVRDLLRLLKLSQAQQGEFVERFTRYAPILPPANRLKLLEEYLTIARQQAFGDWTTLQTVVRHCEALSPAITSQLLSQQLPALLARNTRDYGIGRILLDLAYKLDPSSFSQAVALFQRQPGEERLDYMERFLQVYDIRRQIAASFVHEIHNSQFTKVH